MIAVFPPERVGQLSSFLGEPDAFLARQRAGCGGAANALACMRGVNASTLVAMHLEADKGSGLNHIWIMCGWVPTIDGAARHPAVRSF